MQEMSTAVTEKPKTFVQAVFGELLTKKFLAEAAVNLVKSFLHSFILTLSGHVFQYVSEKMGPKTSMTNPFGSKAFTSPVAQVVSSSASTVPPGYSSQSYPTLSSPKGDERFPGFVR